MRDNWLHEIAPEVQLMQAMYNALTKTDSRSRERQETRVSLTCKKVGPLEKNYQARSRPTVGAAEIRGSSRVHTMVPR